jgi:hypothetical protein
MADLNDFRKRLKEIRDAVEAKLPDIAVTLTLSAKALAERRIKEAGFGAKYSKSKLPHWFLDGKELNQGGAAWLDAKRKKDQAATKTVEGKVIYPDDWGVTWGELRAAQGLQTGHVDLTYTGFTFSNMQPVGIEQQGAIVRAPLGATNKETQDKMNWNRERYGDFIGKALTPNGRELLVEVVVGEVVAVIDSFQQ